MNLLGGLGKLLRCDNCREFLCEFWLYYLFALVEIPVLGRFQLFTLILHKMSLLMIMCIPRREGDVERGNCIDLITSKSRAVSALGKLTEPYTLQKYNMPRRNFRKYRRKAVRA